MRRINYKRKISWLCILLWTSTAMAQKPPAQKENSFSVKQAVDYAMLNATDVKNALLDIQIQKETNREYTSPAFPQINGSFTLNNFLNIPVSLVPAEFTGGPPGTFTPIRFGTKYNATGNLEIEQLLFDGQVFVGLQARSTALKFATKQSEVTKEQVQVNLTKIYYQLVVGKKQLEAVDANIERFEKLLADTKEIFNSGFAEKLDVDKVSVQLNNLKTEKIKIENQLQVGNSALKFLMGMPQQENLVLTDTLSDEELKQDVLDAAYNYNDRKEYQLLSLGKRLNEYNVRRYRLSYIPTISATGSYAKNAQRSKFDFLGDGQWFTTSLIGFRLSVPIFDGFARRSRLNKAKLELQRTNNNIEMMKNAIDNQVSTAKSSISNALLTMDVQKANMQLAESVFNTTKLKYEQGLGSNMEIYNAQADLRVAQTNYYGALYDAIIAKIDFLKATGKL